MNKYQMPGPKLQKCLLRILLFCSAGWAIFLFAGFFAASSAWCQGNQGALEGNVVDQSGAAVADAHLTATNDATGFKLQTASAADGLFTFPVLPVGTYTVEVEHPGFSKLTQKNVLLTVGSRVSLTLTLAVAGQSASVTVSGETPLIETTRSQVSTTVNNTSITNLPTNGRNFINFALLTPGVTTDVRGGDISFAGQRGTLNSLIVDGSDNNNTFFGQTLGRIGSGRAPYQFSEDAVQEFQVNSNAYSAEYGNAGGAVINVITKSGTNEFHGTAFEFYRDRSMNANDPIQKALGKPRQPYHFNQFGGTLGGPILKDKAFFFFDYDGQRNTVANFVFLNLPSNFTPTDANQTTALNYLTARANPWSSMFNQNVYLAKVDWHLTAKHLLSVRYNAQRFTGNNLENGGAQNSVEHTGASDVTSDTATATLTSALRPTLANVFQFNFARDNEPGFANSDLPQLTAKEGGNVVLTAGRNFFSPRFTNIKRGEWDDTVSWTRGRHTIKTGAHFMVDRIANFFPGNFSGQYTFNSLDALGCNLSGGTNCFVPPDTNDTFVQAFAGSGTTGPTTSPNLSEYSGFVQDEWRVKPGLTLNLGLRYDFDKIAQPPTFNPDPQLAAAGIITNKIHNQATDFGPRIGFAWSPLHNSRMVVRGGYGIFYGRTPAITVGTAMSNNGLNVTTLTFTPKTIPSIPQYPNTMCGAPTQSPSCPAPTGVSSIPPIVFGFQQNYKEPDVQQFSLGADYEINASTAFSLTYLHVKGTHLTRTLDINLQGPETPTQIGIVGSTTVLTYNQIPQVASAKAPGSPLRPFSNFSRIEEFQSNADSNYDGMTVQLTKRFAQNYQLMASYTFGKVIDNAPDATSVVPFSFDDSKMVSDPLNVNADKGPGVNDQRHRFVLSGVWNLNYASSLSSSVARGILGGWELSGILTAESGQPYSGFLGFDLNGDGNRNTDRTPGLGRDTFYLPNFISLDPRVTRNVRLAENYKLQFIAEAFNVFNRTNITGVNTTQYNVVGGASCPAGITTNSFGECLKAPIVPFGKPTSTTINGGPGSRILQLAVKFVF